MQTCCSILQLRSTWLVSYLLEKVAYSILRFLKRCLAKKYWVKWEAYAHGPLVNDICAFFFSTGHLAKHISNKLKYVVCGESRQREIIFMCEWLSRPLVVAVESQCQDMTYQKVLLWNAPSIAICYLHRTVISRGELYLPHIKCPLVVVGQHGKQQSQKETQNAEKGKVVKQSRCC